MKRLLQVLACTLGVGVGLAQAHDLVLVPSAEGALVVRYGHAGDWLPVDPAKLLELNLHAGDGSERALRGRANRRGNDLVVPKLGGRDALLVAGRYDNGPWVTIAGPDGKDEHRNGSRFSMPQAKSSMWSLKYAKALVPKSGDTSQFKRELGHWLEIIPQSNPATLKPGELLPVLVRFDGKPLAGAGVEWGDLATKLDEDKVVRFKTDEAGIARIPLNKRGPQLLAVDVERANDGSLGEAAAKLPVDRLLVIATFVFRF